MGSSTGIRLRWGLLLLGIIAAGLLSRMANTGVALIDKYAGDALYAAMVYVLVRMVVPGAGRPLVVFWAGAIMVAIECFQLTGVPADLVKSETLILRVCGRLLGTHFSVLDLLAYGAGIASIAWLDGFIGFRQTAK